MALILKEVTLVCFDTRNIEAAIESMHSSQSQVKFSESILFTTQALCTENIINKAKIINIKLEFVPEIKSTTEYSYFILTELDKYIRTKFCLVTQWDGWVIDSNFWDSNFLNYDYIGAIWPHYSENNIGNGGFSLRSKKLLESTRDLMARSPDFTSPLIEDDYICREKRIIFEETYQIKFPTNEIADKFSVEGNGTPLTSFGFHGMSNFNSVFKIDFDLVKLINKLHDECFLNRASYDLITNLLNENRITIAKLIIRRRLNVSGLSTKNMKLISLLVIKTLLKKLIKK
jgi:hypothetical protein